VQAHVHPLCSNWPLQAVALSLCRLQLAANTGFQVYDFCWFISVHSFAHFQAGSTAAFGLSGVAGMTKPEDLTHEQWLFHHDNWGWRAEELAVAWLCCWFLLCLAWRWQHQG